MVRLAVGRQLVAGIERHERGAKHRLRPDDQVERPAVAALLAVATARSDKLDVLVHDLPLAVRVVFHSARLLPWMSATADRFGGAAAIELHCDIRQWP